MNRWVFGQRRRSRYTQSLIRVIIGRLRPTIIVLRNLLSLAASFPLIVKSNRTFLAVFFLLTTLGISALAYKQYMELITLRTKLGGANSGLEKQLADDEKLIKSLRNQLAALSKAGGGAADQDMADDGTPGAPGDDRNAARRAQRDAMRAIFNSPQFQALRAIQDKSQIEQRYAALFKSLNLTPAQASTMENLLLARQQATQDAGQAARTAGIDPRKDPTGYQQAIASATADVNQQLQATLGDTGYAALQTYNQTMPQRTTVSQLQTSLSYSSTPLTDDQSAALVALMQQNQGTNANANANGGGNRGPGGGGNPFGGGNQGATITPATVTAASSILSAPQLQALQQLQQTQQAQAQMQQLFQNNRPARNTTKGG